MPLNIELRRLTHPGREQRYQKQTLFAFAVTELVKDTLPRGTRVTIHEAITPADLPPVRGSAWKNVVSAVAKMFSGNSEKIMTLSTKRIPSLSDSKLLELDWDGLSNEGPYLTCLVWRDDSQRIPIVEWTTLSGDVAETQGLLKQAISDKSAKVYPDDVDILLLLRQAIAPYSYEDGEIVEARKLLADLDHTFKEVWYFFLMPVDTETVNSRTGVVKRII